MAGGASALGALVRKVFWPKAQQLGKDVAKEWIGDKYKEKVKEKTGRDVPTGPPSTKSELVATILVTGAKVVSQQTGSGTRAQSSSESGSSQGPSQPPPSSALGPSFITPLKAVTGLDLNQDRATISHLSVDRPVVQVAETRQNPFLPLNPALSSFYLSKMGLLGPSQSTPQNLSSPSTSSTSTPTSE
jgi:hypothetical protein